jgi:hypothetical protein
MLAGLAQKMRLHGQGPVRHRLVAALLDEHAADRGLARGRGKIRTIPSIGAVAIDHGDAEQARHAALGRCARGSLTMRMARNIPSSSNSAERTTGRPATSVPVRCAA